MGSVHQYTVILEKQVGLLNGRASNMHNGFYVASYEPLQYISTYVMRPKSIIGKFECKWFLSKQVKHLVATW